jgi:hypothetical protein
MRSWHIHRQSDKAIEDLAHMLNPILRGWIQYYGKFFKSALHPVFQHLNRTLARWASGNSRGCVVVAEKASIGSESWLEANPSYLLIGSCLGYGRRLNDGSRMSGDVQVRF